MAIDRAPTPMRRISKIINSRLAGFAAAALALTSAAAFGDYVLTMDVDLRHPHVWLT